ncbi:MAG: hypothetical protein ABH842_01795 [Candidatus Micrarchaeota archaeon]
MPNIMFCPRCKKPTKAKDYLANLAVVAVLESVLPTISCKCGYRGLPVQLPLSDYKNLIKKSKKS